MSLTQTEFNDLMVVDYENITERTNIPLPGHHRAALFTNSGIIGSVHGESSTPSNDISVKLFIQNNPLFLSYASIRFTVHYQKDNQDLNTTCAYNMWSDNLATGAALSPVNFQHPSKMTPASATHWKSLFNIEAGSDAERYFHEDKLTVVSFSIADAQKIWAINLFNREDFGSQQDAIHNIENYLSNDPKAIYLLVRVEDIESELNDLGINVRAEAKKSPLIAFKPKDTKDETPIFIEKNRMKAAGERPEFFLPPMPVFPTFSHYQVVNGYCVLEEHELAQAQAQVVKEIDAAIFGLQGYADRSYLMLARVNKYETKLLPGDRVTVNFDEMDMPEDRWSGHVMGPLPYQDPLDTAFFINRPVDQHSTEDPKAYRTFDPDIVPTTRITSMNSPADARTALQAEKKYKVVVAPQYSESALTRQLNSLRTIQLNKGGRHTESQANLLMNHIRQFELVDVFKTCQPVSGTIEEAIKEAHERFTLDAEQIKALKLARKGAGRQLFVSGAAGSGKTRLILAFIFILLVSKTPEGGICQVLGCAPINRAATQIINLCNEEFKDLTHYREVPVGPFLFTRFHNPDTEKKILYNTANRDVKHRERYLEADLVEIKDFHAAQTITRLVAQATAAPNKIRDSRVTNFQNSVGMNCARVAGRIDKNGPFDMSQKLKADPATKDWFRAFNNLYARWSDNDQFSKDDSTNFSHAWNELRGFVLRNSHVIACTTNQCSDAKMGAARLSPTIIVHDEAPKAVEADNWCIFMFPDAFKIHLGDGRQNRPSQFNSKNTFKAQGRMAYHSRARIANPSVAVLTNVRRYQAEVAEYVKIFYPDNLFKICNMHNDHPARALIRNFIYKNWTISSQCIGLSVEGSTERTPDNPSRYNRVTLCVLASVLSKLIEFKFPLKWVGILTPYNTQNSLLIALVDHLAHQFPDIDFTELWFGKIDSLQGGERPLLLLDLVVDETLGFMTDDNRPNAGLSRAMVGFIVVGSRKMTTPKAWAETKLAALWQALHRKKCLKEVTDISTSDISELLPALAQSVEADQVELLPEPEVETNMDPLQLFPGMFETDDTDANASSTGQVSTSVEDVADAEKKSETAEDVADAEKKSETAEDVADAEKESETAEPVGLKDSAWVNNKAGAW